MFYNKLYIAIVFYCISLTLNAQDNFVLTSIHKTNTNAVRVKWYGKSFLYPEGVNLYRKEADENNWSKLNSTPIKKGDYSPNQTELKQDKELSVYIDMVNSVSKLEGISLLATYVYSFKSEPFSKYIGIEYIDNSLNSGKSVQYKVTVLKNGSEQELAISNIVTTGAATVVEPPQQIDIIAKNKKATIKWLPETSRYYGVDIYRLADSTIQSAKKITKDPIIISKTKNKAGVLGYPEQFFIDEKLKEDTAYYYSFKSIDFFGDESNYSKPIRVFIKDVNAPEAPLYLDKTVIKKNVTLKWRKTNFEKDFIGYDIYRAFNNEKEYTKANKMLLLKTDSIFTDSLIKNGTYRYVIAAIDRSANEGVTLEIPLEIVDVEPPATPIGLVIKSDTGKIALTWQANTEPDLWGYMVYQNIKKDSKDDNYVLITPEPLRTNEFKQNLAKNSKNKFLYKVLAIDSSYNKSKLSNFAVTTLPDVTPPEPPFIKDVYLNDKKNIVVEFFKNTELDLKGYDLYRMFTEDNIEQTEKVNANYIEKSLFRYIDRDFDNYGLVKYYLVAIDSTNNESKKSNIVKINIHKPEEKIVYEFTDFSVKTTKLPNTWKLKWKLNNSDEVFYMIYTKTESDDNFEPQTKNLTETKYVLNLKSNKKTTIQIRAYNKKGLLAKSEVKFLEEEK